DNEPRDGLSVIAAVSAVSAARAARLKKVAASIQAARETAYREGKIKLLEARFNDLQAALDTALRADHSARTVQVTLVPRGAKLKIDPPASFPDAERSVQAAEAALRQIGSLGPKDVPDGWARSLLASAVVPVDSRLEVD